MRHATWLAVAVVFATQALLLGVYYPKWKLGDTEALISWDVAGYYMYLPAAFVYNDLAGDSYHEAVTQTYKPSPWFDHAFRHEASGAYVMKYSLGQAVQFAPFFAVAHAFAKTSNTYPADGFSRPYQVGIAAEILFFALLSLVLLRVLLRRYFSEGPAAWAIIGVGIGTNYLEYSSMGGGHTHLNLFVMVAAVALLSENFYRGPKFTTAVFIGALVGLAALTRPTEILLGLLPLIWGLQPSRQGIGQRLAVLKVHWPKLLGAAVVGGVILALQPLYWKYASGDWIVYSYQDQGFSFLNPHLWKGLASARAGWLPYTPMGLLMLAGFVPLWRRNRGLALGIITYVALFCYIAWSWDIWWYGGSLGQRTMVQVYPLLALPLAALCAAAADVGGIRRLLLGAGFGVSLLVNLYWTHAAHLGGTLYVSEMNWPYYLATLGRFDRDTERVKLLDGADRYSGTRLDTAILLRETFDELDSELKCASDVANRQSSLCLTATKAFSPRYTIEEIPEDADYLRVYFNAEARQKTWETWAMTQAIVEFKQDGQKVDAAALRPERYFDAGSMRHHFDVELPNHFDEAAVLFWKPGGGGELPISELEVISYRAQ